MKGINCSTPTFFPFFEKRGGKERLGDDSTLLPERVNTALRLNALVNHEGI
jgi:hypothetical protein